MASQAPVDTPVASDVAVTQTLPDRTQNPADKDAPQGEVSKNAAKKAAKAAELAAKKAGKAANKGIGKQEAKKPAAKAPKKKIDGAALIGIDVSKEEDFPGWYQQVLTKGDMLDYYDVSGCFILKVKCPGVALIDRLY
jgi:prolyl-tRNA synthetase